MKTWASLQNLVTPKTFSNRAVLPRRIKFPTSVKNYFSAALAGCLLLGSEWMAGAAPLAGPFFPPPLGVTFVSSGTNGVIGRSTGVTFSFTNTALAAYDQMYWGPTNNGIALSFASPAYSGPGEIMTFSPSQSSLSSGTLFWTGSTTLAGAPINTRCRMLVSTPVVDVATVGLPANVGGVVNVTSPTNSWQATMYFEVMDTQDILGQGAGAWVPALDYFDAAHGTNMISAYSSFAAGFWYSNTSPTISTLPGVIVAPGSTNTYLFQVNDIETPPSLLVVSASSDNQGIVANSNLVTGGSGSTRTLEVITSPGVAGIADVTLTVTDTDGASNSTQFTVLSDTPPSISSITNQIVQENGVLGPLNFTVGDSESSPGSLTLSGIAANQTLIPTANIVSGGSGAARTVTITPAPGQFGTTEVNLTVSDGLLSSSASFSLLVNSPPDLLAENTVTVPQGGTVTITTNSLYATDVESGPSGLTFTIAPGGVGGPPEAGTLFRNGVPLTSLSTFTLADVENNLITYQNNGSCASNDSVQLGLTDSDGGVWSNQGHSVFSLPFDIILPDLPPIAFNTTNMLALGATFQGTMMATNPDCLPQTLTYSLLSFPTNGFLTAFNPNGHFTYVASAGASGVDSFMFQVFNGVYYAVEPGTVTFIVKKEAPLVTNSTIVVNQGQTVTNQFLGGDPNNPPFQLTYSILTNGAKGTATITGPHTGAFTYTPNPARFGTDTVVFQASNGSNSPPATVTVEILPVGTIPGNLLVANLNPPFLVRINPTNGDTGPLASGGYLSAPAAVAYEALGTVLVADQSNGLIRVNPDNGNQTQLVTSNQLPYPLFIAVESTGNILVSDRYNGLQRFNSGGTLITSIPTSGFVLPGGLALANNGQIFASDAAFIAHQPASDKIVEIDPVTFAQTLLSSGGLLVSPTGLAVEPDGSFVSTQFENNEVVRVGFPGGTQTVLTTNSLLNSPFDIAVDGSDDIYLVNRGHDNGTGSVVQVNPESGIQTLIASGGLVGDPLGIAIAGITPPLIITNVVLEGGSVLLQGKGPASSQVDVLGTTNLVIPLPQWLDLGQATEISPGEYQFTDSLAKDYPARFYVLRIP